jgi:hypothetical protein
MQTFLSETTFSGSAEVLDKRRLNSQFKEARQIMDVLFAKPREDGKKIGWQNHPAVLMWKGHEYYLWLYIKRIREECIYRGIKVVKNTEAVNKHIHLIDSPDTCQDPPLWWSDETLRNRVIMTHRARLFVKDPVHYAKYEQWVEPAKELVCCVGKCNYFWPSHHERNLSMGKANV